MKAHVQSVEESPTHHELTIQLHKVVWGNGTSMPSPVFSVNAFLLLAIDGELVKADVTGETLHDLSLGKPITVVIEEETKHASGANNTHDGSGRAGYAGSEPLG